MLRLDTPRLHLRPLGEDDGAFMVALLNDPAFLRYIGDRGVRTPEDACAYIRRGPVASYERFGHGLLLVALRDTGTPIGICGLLRRDTLPDVDVGFAFLPDYCWKGYGFESASAVLADGRASLGLKRIVAITDPENAPSIRLLEKLGLAFERMIMMPGETKVLRLHAWEQRTADHGRSSGQLAADRAVDGGQ
jgi:RimJ/RimL family protein N-acetyltransferase